MSINEENQGFDSFLSEEKEENLNYITPNIEIKLSKEKRQECRDIVKEIKEYGIGQRQFLYLIYLLSLELEDAETMKSLTKVIGENREKTPIDQIEKTRLILSSNE